jgi:ABC transport system ATP-binding/permease protein
MAPPLLLLKDIHLTFGREPLLDGAELSISPGERLCLVGRNGFGRARARQPFRAALCDHSLSAAGSPTSPASPPRAPSSPPGSRREMIRTARHLVAGLGLTGEEEPHRLSGGESRRAALAHVLAPEPDILLLDEPTNHLDIAAIESLEAELKVTRSAFVLISHDRRFLENLSQATVWLDRGTTRRLDKGFAAFEEWRDAILNEEETARHKLDRRLVQEKHWLRYGVSARRKRNVRRLDGLIALRHQLRREKQASAPQDVKLTVQDAGETGRKVIEARHIAKTYGDVAVVRGFSTRITRGDRVGIVGPNGAGKTTLINMLIGTLQPDSGHVKLGTNLEIPRPAAREPRPRRLGGRDADWRASADSRQGAVRRGEGPAAACESSGQALEPHGAGRAD